MDFNELTEREQMKAFIERAGKLFYDDKLSELFNKYHDEKSHVKSNHVHNIVTGSAVKLVRDVIANGGTEEEIDQALKYMIMCINSKKYMLNVKKYSKENGIWDLRKKYQPWRIVSSECTTEDKTD